MAKKLAIPFQIYYTWDGAKRRYIPEFLIKLANGKTLVLEINGEDNEQIRAKHPALGAWVWVKEVNSKGLILPPNFGHPVKQHWPARTQLG